MQPKSGTLSPEKELFMGTRARKAQLKLLHEFSHDDGIVDVTDTTQQFDVT